MQLAGFNSIVADSLRQLLHWALEAAVDQSGYHKQSHAKQPGFERDLNIGPRYKPEDY